MSYSLIIISSYACICLYVICSFPCHCEYCNLVCVCMYVFVCVCCLGFWMSDKIPVQQELADRLSQIIQSFPVDRCHEFITAFYDTLMREWVGIDVLRMDKFMSLVRKFFNQTLLYLQNRKIAPVTVKSQQHTLTNKKKDKKSQSSTEEKEETPAGSDGPWAPELVERWTETLIEGPLNLNSHPKGVSQHTVCVT